MRCAALGHQDPPLPLIPHIIRKILAEQAEVLLVAPMWPRRPWYADLLNLSIFRPWRISDNQISLSQGVLNHPNPPNLQLAVWHLREVS